jgi:exodeoxyribonuclease-3
MKITSWNVNGLRSPSQNIIDKKNNNLNKDSNMYKLLNEYDPDILCIGETKCQEKNEDTFNKIFPFKFNCWNSSKEKLGYSGVCIFSKVPFVNLGSIPGMEGDNFGRNLLLDFDTFILCYVYVPNSGGGKDIYRKEFWDEAIYNFLKTNYNTEKPIIYCGDLNVVADENDIYNPTPLRKGVSPGTKKYEREDFQSLLELGYFDSHRLIYPEDKLWTWWDPRSKARLRDDGWRLDYFLISTPQLLSSAIIHKYIYGSDHCPISIELNI